MTKLPVAVVVVMVVLASEGELLGAAERADRTEEAEFWGGAEREALGGTWAVGGWVAEDRDLRGLKRGAWTVVHVFEAERTAVEKGE